MVVGSRRILHKSWKVRTYLNRLVSAAILQIPIHVVSSDFPGLASPRDYSSAFRAIKIGGKVLYLLVLRACTKLGLQENMSFSILGQSLTKSMGSMQVDLHQCRSRSARWVHGGQP
jgi:hypothetical protein